MSPKWLPGSSHCVSPTKLHESKKSIEVNNGSMSSMLIIKHIVLFAANCNKLNAPKCLDSIESHGLKALFWSPGSVDVSSVCY